MRLTVLLGLMLSVLVLSGCASQIYYPDTQTFDPKAELKDQLAVATKMQNDYRTKKENLARDSNNTSKANIGLGALTASAAAFGAHIDTLKGLALVTGTHAAGAATFKVGDQMQIYRAGESALACVADKANKLNQHPLDSVALTAIVHAEQCQRFTNAALPAAKGEPKKSDQDIAKAQLDAASCKLGAEQMKRADALLELKAQQAAAIDPKAVFSASLRSIDKAVFDKLQSTLSSKDAATFANELKTQLEALKVKEETDKLKNSVDEAVNPASGLRFTLEPAAAAAFKAKTLTVEMTLTFEAELQKCVGSAGL